MRSLVFIKKDILEEEIDEIDNECSNCSSSQLVVNEGMMCCRDCGIIDGEHILESANNGDIMGLLIVNHLIHRCGMLTNEFLPKSSLGSVIGHSRIGSK